jgi:hypothetical protein
MKTSVLYITCFMILISPPLVNGDTSYSGGYLMGIKSNGMKRLYSTIELSK